MGVINIIETLYSILSDFVIAVMAALLTYLFAIRKFRSEKWWELKVTAYQRVIEALHNSKEYSSQYSDVALGIKTLTPEKDQQLKERALQASHEIAKAIDMGTFIMSEDAIKRLEVYKKSIDVLTNDSQDMFTYFDKSYGLTNDCLKDLRVVAKKDLEKSHL